MSKIFHFWALVIIPPFLTKRFTLGTPGRLRKIFRFWGLIIIHSPLLKNTLTFGPPAWLRKNIIFAGG
jgi:hypothetical protein